MELQTRCRVGSREAGFSLLELMVVSAISLSLAAIAGFQIIELHRRFLITEMAGEFAALAREARVLAMGSGQDVRLQLSESDVAAVAGASGAAVPYKSFTVSEHLVMRSNRNPILFSPSGVCSPASIEIHSFSMSCIIAISLRGRVRIECS